MEEEIEIEDFEENSVDPFNSAESDIDDSDSENEYPANRIVDFLCSIYYALFIDHTYKLYGIIYSCIYSIFTDFLKKTHSILGSI